MFVACKLPNGLTLSGAGETVTIAGYGTLDQMKRIRQRGYAISQVPDEVWKDWLKKHSDADVVKNQLVVADEQEQTLIARLYSIRGKSGFEQVGPGKINA